MPREHFSFAKKLLLAFAVAAGLALAGSPTVVEAAQTPADEPGKPDHAGSPTEPGAQPETAPEKTPPVTGREIVVTATRTEREVFDVPSSAAVVDKKKIEREPQGTIAEQLRDIPGIQVNDGGMGGGAKRVSIRGESSARVLVLIDGMKISEQKSMDGSMIMIDPLNVERIEVIKGPASVLYGSEAIGGVINIITKKGGERPIQGAAAVTVDGSNGSATPFGTLYGTYKGFGYRISGDYTDAGNKRGGSGTIADSGYLQTNASIYLDYSWETGKIGGGYDRFWSNINIPGAKSDGADVELDLPLWQRERFYSFLEFEQISDVLQKIKLTAFTQETKKDFWNDIRVATRVQMGPNYMLLNVQQHPYTKNDQKSYGGNLQTDWTFGEDHYVIAGIDYLYDDLEAEDDRRGMTMRRMYNGAGTLLSTNITNTHDTFNYDAHQQTIALFAQDEWTFHPDWTATFGLRQTWLQSALDETNDPTLDEVESRDSHLVGSLGLVYSGFQDWRLRALYSQGYRYPLLNQLYIGTTHGSSGRTYPNPDLEPETSHNFEVGARYEAEGFAADLAVYYNMAKDYITTATLPAPNPSKDMRFENVNTADTYGSELTVSYTHEPWGLTPYLSGASMHRTFDYGGVRGETSDVGDPSWTGRVGLRYEHDFGPEVNFHVDAFGRFAARCEEDLSDGTTEQHAGWGTANLAIGARFGKERNLFMDLNLNNLLDKRYTTASNTLEEPGFHAVMRMGVEF